MSALAAVALASLLAYAPQKGPVGLRPLDFEAAQAAARAERRPLLVLVCDGGRDCERLSKTTLRDRKLRAWMDEKLVAIQVAAGDAPELLRRFKVRQIPSWLVLDGRGVELDRVVGAPDARALRSEVEEIVKGGDALARWTARLAQAPEDALVKLRVADLHAGRGELDRALAGYLEVFDEGGPECPAALDELKALGRIYPKALETIGEIAGRLEPRVQAGEATEHEVREWLDLCDAAGSTARVVWMYDALAEAEAPAAKELRARLALRLREVFYIDGRYADLEPFLGDPKAAFEARLDAHAGLVLKKASAAERARSLRELREATARDYEVLLGLLRLGRATLLADALITFDPTAATYESLVEHALRAGQVEEAKIIARRGRADVRIPEEARAKIAGHLLDEPKKTDGGPEDEPVEEPPQPSPPPEPPKRDSRA